MGNYNYFLKAIKKTAFIVLICSVFYASRSYGQTSDLVISLKSDISIGKVGDNVVFTVDVKNLGPDIAINTKVTDVLPSGYSFVSANPSRGTFANPIWSIGSLSVNETASITITAKISPFGNYTNTVAVKADQPDLNLADNSAKTSLSVIRAIDDYAYVNETATGTIVGNVLANDYFNGSFAVISKLKLSKVSSSNPSINLNSTTGEITLTSSLPTGNYSLVYKIEDKQNPLLFTTGTVFINSNSSNGGIIDAPIIANHDAGTAPEIVGGIAVFNILANDKLAGEIASLNNVELSFLSSSDPNISLDLATANVLVAPNTPGGPYILNYKITSKADASITATSYVTVNVIGTGSLDTKDDNGSVNGITGGVAVANVLANDLFNGSVIKIQDVDLTQLFSNNPGIALNVSTGQVDVAPNTPNGFFTLTYQVTDKLDAANKGAADVIVTVTGGANVITANEDRGVANGTTGGIAIDNILLNDEFKGAAPNISDVFISQLFSNNSAINIDFNIGQVIVNPGTKNGFYTLTYQIQDRLNQVNVSFADIIVEIKDGVSPLTAKEDAGFISGVTGGVAVANVLSNDDLAGLVPTLTEVTIQQTFSNNPGINLDVNTGQVIVDAGTENGVYTIAYYVEDINNPESSSYADVIVTVTQDNLALLANPDVGAVDAIAGGIAVANVLENDILTGRKPLIAEINLSQITTENAGVKLDIASGSVVVDAGTANGVYKLNYQIEDKANPGIVSVAEVTVTVSTGSSVIAAIEDKGTVNSVTGGIAVANILANDLLNNKTPLVSEVTITQLYSSDNQFFNIDVGTGQAIVNPNAPIGFFTITYQIEDKLNAAVSSIADVIIEVTSINNPVLANDDAGTVNGYAGGTAITNVLDNDLLNNMPITSSEVSLSLESSTNVNVSLNIATGNVSVLPGTTAGDYELVYKIIDKLNPSNFSVATVKIKVTPAPISASDDAGTVNGFSGGTAVANVLTNDFFNGATALPANVLISQTTINPNITIDLATGKVTVSPNTPANVYSIDYKITDQINPTNFATAKVVVTVTAPVISASDDAGTVNGFSGGTAVANVLTNDFFNGATALTANVAISQTTVNSNITIDPATGKVTVSPNTPANVYSIDYKITDKINPTNFATAKVVVTVTAPVISASDDAGTVNGFSGGTAVANVLTNDFFNGATALPANVVISQTTINPNITIDPATGKVTVSPNTPANLYSIDYKITDKINPTNFATAKVVVTVTAPVISASDDAGTVNGFSGGTAVANVLTNDFFNGATALPANVSISQTTINPNITIDPATGKVTVSPNTPANVYSIDYKITDKINPTNFAIAKVGVTVKPSSILAVDDVKIVEGAVDVVAISNIVGNDYLNDAPTDLTKVNITNVINPNPNILVDGTTGSVTVKKEALAGIYILNYTVQDKANASLNSTAKITITINPKPILGIAKSVEPPKKEVNGSFTLTYRLTAKNYGNTELNSVSIIDDLRKTFPDPVNFTVIGSVQTSGTLLANPNFNGTTITDLLSNGSVLQPNQEETISFGINVKLNNTVQTVFDNTAFGTANSSGGMTHDGSTDGTVADPNNDNTPDEEISTSITLNKATIRIPQGFSPNNDGVHDKFIIENTAGDTINLEVFNRWGNVVYRSADYQNDWTGQSNEGITIGEDLPDGTYYYVVKVNGKEKYVKYLTIKR